MRFRFAVAALLASCGPAMALSVTDGLTADGYADLRLVSAPTPASWLEGGLGKYGYGDGGAAWNGEGVLQLDATLAPDLHALTVLRAEARGPDALDALETYLRYDPASERDLSWSLKLGAFFPPVSQENDDLGWTSPYTITPSAIDSWIGDELRTIGGEATLRWQTTLGTWSLISALFGSNDEAGILMADRGWTLDDRPTGLFERVRLPNATEALFGHGPATTGMFDEIDGRPGWYLSGAWQMTGIGKITLLRYDNDANPAARTLTDTAWDTSFWSAGARTAIGPLTLIAQGLSGQTGISPRPGAISDTRFSSAYLMGVYDIDDDWRAALRGDIFQTRHVAATASPLSEDGDAATASIAWSGYAWLRLTAEASTMHVQRAEFVRAGLADPRQDTQLTLDARFFF